MKKIYFLALLICLGFTSFAQTTVTVFATGATGSYTTGNATTATRTDNTMFSGGFASSRSYAVFNLSSVPLGATVTSCVIGFYVNGYYGGGTPSGWNTYGYAGNLSTVTTAATLYADMVAGTSLSTATYGTATGNHTLASTAAADAFIQTNEGGTVSICFTGGGPITYSFTGEVGAGSLTGTPAPYMQITYTCAGVSGVTATAAPNPLCVGATLTLTGSGAGISSYSWAGPGSYISGVESPTLTTTATSAGVYTLTAYSATGCGTQATTASVVLSATPVASISTTSPTLFCQGGSVVLTGTAGAGYDYQWYQSGGVISGATDQTYTASDNGDYTVMITNSTTGCASTSSGEIVSVLPDHPQLSPAGLAAICVGSYQTLSVDMPGVVTTGLSYEWEKNGIPVASGGSLSTYTTDSAGVYNCVLIAPACYDTTQPTTVEVLPLPVPVVTNTGGVLTTSNAYAAYQWFLNLVALPGATSYTLNAANNGSYRVRVTDGNGCTNYSVPFALNDLGVAQLSAAPVKIYPNPATETVHIESPVTVHAIISTMEGRKMLDITNATDVNIQELPSGLYLVMLYNETGERIAVDKLIKE